MTFFKIVRSGVVRRPIRSVLTAVGIAIGVGTGVAMAAIAWGFEHNYTGTYEARGTDAVVGRLLSGSLVPGVFDQIRASEVASLPGVKDVAAILSDVQSIEEADGLLVSGWETDSFLWQHLRMCEGDLPKKGGQGDRVWIGTVAASLLGKKAGDSLKIKTSTFVVAGIFESGALVENAWVLMSLPAMQELSGRTGKINFLNLRLAPEVDEERFELLQLALERKFRGLKLFRTGEVASHYGAVQVAKLVSLATSGIALSIGMLGLMNAVAMSVHERRREIGLLAALGWGQGRIASLFVSEALLLGTGGAILGMAIGTAGVVLLESMDFMRGRIDVALEPTFLGVVFVVASGLSLLAGFWPAWKAASIEPRESLQGG